MAEEEGKGKGRERVKGRLMERAQPERGEGKEEDTWGGGRRKSRHPSLATRSDPGFPHRLGGPDAAPEL